LLSLLVFGLTSFSNAVSAAESEGSAAAARHAGLAQIDWILIALYALTTIALGAYYGRRQKSTEEYFIGSGAMSSFFVGVSLFATLLSSISYLSMPGESAGKGPVGMLTVLGLPVVYFIVAYGLLPIYMKQRVTSAYELLELKLGLGIRLFGATMFILLRLVWMSLLIYLSCKALVQMIDIESLNAVLETYVSIPPADTDGWIQRIAIAAGLVAVIYTSIGGLSAVVMTDFLQTVLLFGGAWLVIFSITWSFGGLEWFPTGWQEHWDEQPLIDFDPRTRVTVFGTVLSFLIWYVCTSGGDQTSVQRFMATSDLRAARKALATQLCAAGFVAITLGCVGFALMSFYSGHPELWPEATLKKSADSLFPQYIAYQLPVGVSGLVVAALFAAAMSSIDSGVNSITAVVMTDYLDRFGLRPQSERNHVYLARVLALSIGTVVVFGAAYIGMVPGNITAVTQKTSNLLTTPIFALFFFALFVPFARPAGVWAGAVVGITTAVCIAFSGPIVILLHDYFQIDPETFGVTIELVKDEVTDEMRREATPEPISFQWIAPCALGINIAVGTAVSWWLSRGSKTE
jgi:SSS family solute:Na+ symporter